MAQETIFRLRNLIESQQISLEPFFKSFDEDEKFLVTKTQMRKVFAMNSILVSDKEADALMECYGNVKGFKYQNFLKEINESMFDEDKHAEVLKLMQFMSKKKPVPCGAQNFSIVDVFANIKNQIDRKRINFDKFLVNGEKWPGCIVSETFFRFTFTTLGINLKDCELDILCNTFKVPCRPGCIDNGSFCKTIRQAFE